MFALSLIHPTSTLDSTEAAGAHANFLCPISSAGSGSRTNRVGTIEPGRQADFTLDHPEALAGYDSEANTIFEYRRTVATAQTLYRSDGAVANV
jgi:hypothetical protein